MNKYRQNLEKFIKSWQKDPNLQFIKKLANEFENAEFYLVGGMVRDLALGKVSKDYDIVAKGIPEKKLENALKNLGTVDLVGKTFGVLKFLPKKSAIRDAIDIALPRTEHAFGTGAYRDFKIKSDYKLPIEKDLARRDFTINAIAIELKSEIRNSKFETNLKLKTKNSKLKDASCKPQASIIDPFGGLDDLQIKKIRCVGKPQERFKEDYSRMLRALRLSCQLDFDIENDTWKTILKNIKNINKKSGNERLVPFEVIAKELVKAFSHNPAWALELFDKAGALKMLAPELIRMKGCPQPENFHSEGDVWQHTKLALQKLYSKEFKKEFATPPIPPLNKRGNNNDVPREVIWGVIFHDVGKPYTITMADRLRFNEHDMVSVKIFRKTAEILKLSSAGLNIETVEKIIGKHMLQTSAKINEMRETTIEKYFFNDQFPGAKLLMLIFADISATVPPSGKPDFSSYIALKARISKLKKTASKKVKLPDELLDGNEIMALLGITPGPKIKTVKEYLRELQLSEKIKNKKEARAAAAKKFKK